MDFSKNEGILPKTFSITYGLLQCINLIRIYNVDIVDGTPKASMFVTLGCYFGLFPAIVIWSAVQSPYSLNEWAVSGWEDNKVGEGRPYEQFMLCCLTANMFKDFFFGGMTPVFYAHHGISLFLFYRMLNTNNYPALFCAGVTMIEIGSGSYLFYQLFQTSENLNIYMFMITCSNFFSCLTLMYWVILRPIVFERLFLASLAALLIVARQRFAIQTWVKNNNTKKWN